MRSATRIKYLTLFCFDSERAPEETWKVSDLVRSDRDVWATPVPLGYLVPGAMGMIQVAFSRGVVTFYAVGLLHRRPAIVDELLSIGS
jgi:hypothetical protein